MSGRPKDESWTYKLKPPAGVEVANPHSFDIQSDVCTKFGAMATEVEDSIVSYESHVTKDQAIA